MSNRNHNLNNGTGNKTPEAGMKQKLIHVNWKKVAKTCGKIAVGFCAAVGAAGLGSYAADQITKSKNPAPTSEEDTTVF